MTQQEFLAEASRLVQRYGEKHYPVQVLELIFQEVKSLKQDWFSKLVTKFIASEHFAPLLPKIKEYSAQEKRKDLIYRPVGSRTETIFSESEVVEIIKTVQAVAKGTMTRDAAVEYSKMLKRVIEDSGQKPNCPLCNDSGLVLMEQDHSNPYSYRCKCSRGQYRKENFPVFREA